MMSTPTNNVPTRKSFAQVAAAANKVAVKPKTSESSNQDLKIKNSNSTHNDKCVAPTTTVSGQKARSENPQPEKAQDVNGSNNDTHVLANNLQAVSLNANTLSAAGLPGSNGKTLGFRHETSDVKSSVSRTTVPSDEKESLRPDDSASMQAVTEDEVPSPAESFPGSRKGSVSDAPAFQDQLNVIDKTENSRMLAKRAMMERASDNGPQSNGLPMSSAQPVSAMPCMAPPQNFQAVNGPPAAYVIPPDEKLLEALESPKDRLFVLKIEQDMIDFIKDPKEMELQLPQTNSFYRLLSHKLAEYYFLGHIYDETATSVRIFRQPYSRLPPPLIGHQPDSKRSTPPLMAQTRKIMQRGMPRELASKVSENIDSTTIPVALPILSRDPTTGENSDVEKDGAADEKEIDIHGKDNGLVEKDRANLTREEREKRYAEARERIFKDIGIGQSSNDTPSNADAALGISRSSSSSGVKKTRRQKKPKDDSFEARSAYSQYGGHAMLQSSQSPASYNSTYPVPYSNFTTFSGNAPVFQPTYTPMGPSASQHFMAPAGWTENYDPGFYGGPNSNNSSQYPPINYGNAGNLHYNSSGFASPATPKAHHPTLATYNKGYQSQPMQDQNNWSQMGYQYGYMTADANLPQPNQNINQMMYQMPYGMPNGSMQPDMYNYGSMAPGNFNSPPQFNTQTQPFVPQMQMNQMPINGNPGNNGNVWYPNATNMQRQRSGTSFGPNQGNQTYIASPTRSSGPSSAHAQQRSYGRHPHQVAQSGIAKFGSAPSLPAKPPPTSSTLSFQPPKHTNVPQPLPSNPFAGSNDDNDPIPDQQDESKSKASS